MDFFRILQVIIDKMILTQQKRTIGWFGVVHSKNSLSINSTRREVKNSTNSHKKASTFVPAFLWL